MLYQVNKSIKKNKVITAIAIVIATIFSVMCGYMMRNGLIVFVAQPSMILFIKSWFMGTSEDNDVRWFSAFICTLCILIATL